ncbi:MAG: YdeI/OmpD-associated family protein [Gammaproteobacteria bacterium]
MASTKQVDTYIKKHPRWAAQLDTLRKAVISAGLEETIKWGLPTYTRDGKNLIGLAAFKNHCALWFHNGSFLKDKAGKLLNAQEGRTRGLRQWRFEEGDKIPPGLVNAYIKEAIANHDGGIRITPQKKSLVLPVELSTAFKKNAKLKKAFDGLTPGKQREYAEHIASAKQEKTRLNRLKKATPLILKGAGLHDKYKNC